jgi:hypothetical protein
MRVLLPDARAFYLRCSNRNKGASMKTKYKDGELAAARKELPSEK